MSVLVAGAGGFIGQAVLQALRAAGVPGVLPAGRQGLAVTLDLAAPRLQLPAGIDTVLNLAGEKHVVARMQAINADAAERLADAAARAGARSFVHLSSVGVYGAPPYAGLVTESFPHTPRGPYETSKDDGERRVRQRCAALGLRCVVLQPANVIGKTGGRRPLLGLVGAVASGRFRYIGAPRGWVNYVAVEDVAAAVVAACQQPGAAGTWIVNTPARLADVVGWIADTLGRPPPTASLPDWLGRLAAQAGAASRVLLRREPPFSPERYLELTNTTRFDAGAAAAGLSWRSPVGIEATIRGLAAAYRSEGLV